MNINEIKQLLEKRLLCLNNELSIQKSSGNISEVIRLENEIQEVNTILEKFN